jgi:hypothetical protein
MGGYGIRRRAVQPVNSGGVMAITLTEYCFLRHAYKNGLLPQGVDLLEFGEAHTPWRDIEHIFNDTVLALSPTEREDARRFREEAPTVYGDHPVFNDAKTIYHIFFKFRSCTSVDLGGTPKAIIHDLNRPLDLGRRFGVCVNNGTSEHIFNQHQFFKTMHDHTEPGGLMIHWTPVFGWVNHGFYNLQPTTIFALSQANNYEILIAAVLGPTKMLILRTSHAAEAAYKDPEYAESILCFILRKRSDEPFKTPQQGCYADLAP